MKRLECQSKCLKVEAKCTFMNIHKAESSMEGDKKRPNLARAMPAATAHF